MSKCQSLLTFFSTKTGDHLLKVKGAEGGHNFNYHLYQCSIAALQITPELSNLNQLTFIISHGFLLSIYLIYYLLGCTGFWL